MKIIDTDEELLEEINKEPKKPKAKKPEEDISNEELKELDETIEEEMEEEPKPIKKMKPITSKAKKPKAKEPEIIGNFMIEVIIDGVLITRKYSRNPTATIQQLYKATIETDNGTLLKIADANVISFNVVRLE